MIKKKTDSILGIIALVIIIIAWYIGVNRAETDIIIKLQEACPEAPYILNKESNVYHVYKNEGDSTYFASLLLNSSSGYGGEIQVATLIGADTLIYDTRVIDHKETHSFFKKVKKRNFNRQFNNKSLKDKFILNDDIDAVTGATFTTRAYNEAVRKSVLQAGNDIFGLDLPSYVETQIVFGKYEIVWIIFLILAYLSIKIKTKKTKLVRWIMLLSGMLVIGFIYNIPLSIGLINKGILGFWPSLNHQFYFYIMLGGVSLIILLSNKNLYCERICPFGATQECLSAISGTKRHFPKQIRPIFKWIQRLLALGVIVLALLMRNPNYANYEIFGTMFRLTGGNFAFILLIVFLLLSLIIVQPWCNLLCPVKPVTDYLKMIRRWIVK